jgi:hypothetical protein
MQIVNIRTNIAKIATAFLLSLAIASCGGGSNEPRVDDITNNGGDGVSRVDDITNGSGEGVSRVDDITYSGSDIHLRLGEGNNEVYGSGTLNDDDPAAIYLNGNEYYQPETPSIFLGVMPNGSLLLRAYSPSESTNLYLVDVDFTLIPLIPPVEEPHSFHPTAKAFIDPVTGNQSVWVVANNGNVLNPIESRWSIDLVTNTVTNDGVLTAIPEDLTGGLDKSTKINGSGEVIQTAFYLDDLPSNNYWVALKRGLESSDGETEILYSEENIDLDGMSWVTQQPPFVFILNNLVTEP